MIFTHVSLVQEGESALFYRFDRSLNGYMIAGVFVAPNIQAKLNDLNNRVSKLETVNIKSMQVDNRFSKIESRLGL